MNLWLPAQRLHWGLMAIGVLALGGCVVFAINAPQQTLLAYLFAFVFFTGLCTGSLALLMVHALTGGAWGFRMRPGLLAAARIVPLQALLVLPILFGVHALYPWASTAAQSHDPILRAQGWYLNVPFFVIRSLAYFAFWWLLLRAFVRHIDDPLRSPRLAAAGLIGFALTSLLAATDWIMSLLPHWHSSTLGLLVATGWMLGAAALAVVQATFMSPQTRTPPDQLHDLGNLLLMFVLAWAYLAYMQYLTIWIADLPDETAWYIPRTLTSWRVFAWFLIAMYFAIPFFVLLSRRAKRCRRWVGATASVIVFAGLLDAFWLVIPTFRPAGILLYWSDAFALLGIGALWTGFYLRHLRTQQCIVAGDLPAPVSAHVPTHARGGNANG